MLLDHADDMQVTEQVSERGDGAGRGVATLRLVCLVRAGDGYLVRAVAGPLRPGQARRHVDITFGDAADRGRSAELEAVVRQIQRWCDEGTPADLVDTGTRLALHAADGTRVTLPHSS